MPKRDARNREYRMRAAWPFVICCVRIGLWATLCQSICSSVSASRALDVHLACSLWMWGPLTSFRSFCCRMANRKRAIALSLLEDMMAMLVEKAK